MTAKELIAKLQQLPEDTEMFVSCPYNRYGEYTNYSSIDGDDILIQKYIGTSIDIDLEDFTDASSGEGTPACIIVASR